MADMVELADSNGDTSVVEAGADSKPSDVKQNGDANLNGSCDDSAMEVDETPAVTKKVVNNEIVNTENSDSNSESVEKEKVLEKKEKDVVKNGNVEKTKGDGQEEMQVEENEIPQDTDIVINENESEGTKGEADPFAGDETSQPAKDSEDNAEKVAGDDLKEDKEPVDLGKKREKENGDEDEAMEVDGEQKLNGSNSSDETNEQQDGEDEEDNGDGTPKKNKKNTAPLNLTPRRSSRNLNKSKSYQEKDEKDIELIDDESKKKSFDDDVQEIAIDPLADTSKPKPRPIVISDTKTIPNIMASINKVPPKKEPTLVIIDTNSILSGRGPVPVAHSSPQTVHRQPAQLTMLPVQNKLNQNKVMSSSNNKPAVPAQPPILLPSLTDDMFVVEAPSFIVPYVYEKPPVKPLKEFVDDLDKTIKKEKDDAEKEKLKKEEEKKKGKEDKDKSSSDVKDKEDKEKEEDEDSKSEKGDKKEETEENDKDKKSEDEDKTDADKKSDKDDEETKEEEKREDEKKGGGTYFDNALGKFFMHIGINLVQEHVQNDLLKSQKRKREREGTKVSSDTLQAISSLTKTLEFSKENNDPFRFDTKKCEYCNFKTESQLVMAHHLETPHMKNYIYRCNFCPLEVRSPHDIMYHMEAEHNVRGRLEKAPAFHQCPSCLFEDNQKGKLTRHLLSCAKKYRPERNQEPPLDWEPPAKIPRVSRNRPNAMSPGNAVYHAAMSGLKQNQVGPAAIGAGGPQIMPKMMTLAQGNAAAAAMSQALMNRQRGRPLGVNTTPGLLYRPTGPNAQNLVLPAGYSIQGGQIVQTNKGASAGSTAASAQTQSGQAASKLLNQPSISITPLPRQGASNPAPSTASTSTVSNHPKPGRPQAAGGAGGKNTFVICEICDGYIKDLEQLRNHMQWIHKVKIHPKMIYNRPPLNCQKCQFRFFTDQGLERHLLGSHGLVTSSMQEAANKGKDGGRCPVCGRVYQWKLLNHVARDHNMSLKPAHLSYKCTVCTATFGMYRQFENHVYSAHSVAPRRPATDKKPQGQSTDPMLKPLKINDEITIIPQPPRPTASSSSSTSSSNNNKVKITPVPSKK
ncbi:hypothetical protein M8J76_016911 [Diaphorina citri]|nr:hypothetical protein M8J76_016911 [Diaphorina citri]